MEGSPKPHSSVCPPPRYELNVMNESEAEIDLFPQLQPGNTVASYQPTAGADGSRSSHIRGFHSAEKVAGIPIRKKVLSPVGTAVPRLQDVAIGNQVIVCSQIEH